ncbi:hypothetical protein F5Y19DRAFT_83941 [Xylariaceae sp. FL1651]|nr:hypothetical protein F5Y19DRAFT_83941 [Xylariaceae sp. FL1651]
MASSMIYSYIPILPPLLLALARNQQPTQSDEDLAREFKLPSAAYTEKRGKHTIDIHWQSYLALNNYLFPFQPLRGTERDRYGPIIKAARDEETRRHYFECETFHALLDAEPWIEKLCNTPLALLLNRRGLKHPRKSLLPTSEQLTKDKLTVQRGLDKLREIYVGYLEPGLRHYRQHPDFFKRRFMTKFGVVTACCILPDEPWYLGHRPGDPIGRVRRDPQRRKPTEEEKLFVVPELAGSEDGDEIEKYAIRFEGVVPFSYRELYQRFTRYAFPRFVLMVIAALGFDPQDPEYKVHPHMKQVEKLLTREFIKISDRDRAASLKLLRRIWHVKYCNVAEKYPRFLKNQIVSSISRLREMGWLMSKLEREAPSPIGCHYWKHCKGLLEDMAGRDAAWLAQEYFDITLAAEAEELMGDGNMENILLYKHSRKSRDIAKVRGSLSGLIRFLSKSFQLFQLLITCGLSLFFPFFSSFFVLHRFPPFPFSLLFFSPKIHEVYQIWRLIFRIYILRTSLSGDLRIGEC